MFTISRYTAGQQQAWNSFVAQSKQGTFLFDRGYMDYHRERFEDHSLMIYRDGRLYALLPANMADGTLHSHQGLTYGGLLTDRKASAEGVCGVFAALNSYLRSEGIHHVVYKPMPFIYHRMPAEEDLYALTHICHAQLTARHLSSALSPSDAPRFSELRRRGIRKAQQARIEVAESQDTDTFWEILNSNLRSKYHVAPVHTAAELRLLQSRFPHAIRLFMATKDRQPMGGTLVFETPQVIHTQYISATPEGKRHGALDLLFDFLIHRTYASARWFDFGRSTTGDGRELNTSLIFQKEGFCGRGVCYDCYEYEIK